MSNRFRDPTMRKHYAAMVLAFATGHRDVGTPTARCTGNSFASAFWRGFDGVTTGLGAFADRSSRATLAYACYRAGADCAVTGHADAVFKDHAARAYERLVEELRSAPVDGPHDDDDKGPCLCSCCNFRRRRAVLLAELGEQL